MNRQPRDRLEWRHSLVVGQRAAVQKPNLSHHHRKAAGSWVECRSKDHGGGGGGDGGLPPDYVLRGRHAGVH